MTTINISLNILFWYLCVKFQAVEDQKAANRREAYLKKHEHLLDTGFKLNETVRTNGYGSSSRFSLNPGLSHHSANSSGQSSTSTDSSSGSTTNENVKPPVSNLPNHNGAIKKPPLIPRLDDTPRPKGPQGLLLAVCRTWLRRFFIGLLPCQYCELELPKLDLEEHENYCGSRTDKCLECGELVMFKNKQSHWDSNHGFVKLRDGESSVQTKLTDIYTQGVIHSLSKVFFLSFIKLALIGQTTFLDQSPFGYF